MTRLFLPAAAVLLVAAAPDPRSAEAARAAVERYYALIEARDYPAAYALWGENGPPGQTPAQFAAGYARTATVRATVAPPGRVESGMGQSWVTVPVQVEARLTDGTRQRFTGRYVVSRVNDVPGSTPAQRRWHLRNARLRAVPPAQLRNGPPPPGGGGPQV